MAFDPKAHMKKLQGKDYLEVKWRLVWFREDHPDWGIRTTMLHYDAESAMFKAEILNADGHLIATGHKQESKKDFGDYAEKAETGAIGRALANAGYGTQFAPELEEGERIVDSPVERKGVGEQKGDKPMGSPSKPASEKQANLILDERKKRQDGWAPIFEALKANGHDPEALMKGKKAEEIPAILQAHLTSQQASQIIDKLKELPYRSEATANAG